MKTLTIKHEMVEELDNDECKLEFANTVISMFIEHDPTTNNHAAQSLYEGLNDDLPEPLPGSPEFDSSNMAAAEYKRFSMVRAGYFPVSLNCGYADYKYKHWDEFSEDELLEMLSSVSRKIRESKGRKDFQVLTNYIQQVWVWYCDNRKTK